MPSWRDIQRAAERAGKADHQLTPAQLRQITAQTRRVIRQTLATLRLEEAGLWPYRPAPADDPDETSGGGRWTFRFRFRYEPFEDAQE